MVRVLVFGAGSVGTVYAMILHQAGASVTCICRSNLEAARSDGLTVRSTILGNHTFFPPVVASAEEAVAGDESSPFDFVLVCTKATGHSPASSTSLIRPAIRIGYTSIVVIQNGVGVEQMYREAFPSTTIISGVTYVPTTQIGPTTFSHGETQILHLGPFPTADASAIDYQNTESFAALIKAGGGQVTTHQDVQIERWKKLIGNTTWNPICALSRCRDLEFLQSSALAADFMIKAMHEVVAVANALGYGEHVQAAAVDAQVQRSARRRWPGVEPSMLSDLRNGRSMEVEAIIGQVVKLAKAHAVEVPRLESLYVLLTALDWFIRQEKPGAQISK